MKRAPPRHAWLVVALLAVVATGLSAAATADVRARARAARALADGRPQAALRLLEGRWERHPDAAFLFGTALLEGGRPRDAVPVLSRAVVAAGSPEMRRRALHNLSVAHLRLASLERGARDVHARAGAAAAGDALRLRPGVPGTQWNLALAQRLLQRGDAPTPVRPGDGGIRLTPSGSAPPGDGTASPALSAGEAERILDALRSEEGATLNAATARLLGSTGGSPTKRGPPW